ncbi:MAG: SRPBCC family protein [bacterium]|nr:SRPBCC family protein [bacterium]
MPQATFTHQITADAPVETVWNSLQKATTWANIGPVENVTESEVDADGQLLSFKWSTSVATKRYPGTAEVVASEPQERMVLDLDAREVAGSLETQLAANGDGTTIVTVTLEVISRGTMSTLFFPMVRETIANGLPAQVEQFAESLG